MFCRIPTLLYHIPYHGGAEAGIEGLSREVS